MYVLMTRGEKGDSGYLNVCLNKVDNGRVLVVETSKNKEEYVSTDVLAAD